MGPRLWTKRPWISFADWLEKYSKVLMKTDLATRDTCILRHVCDPRGLERWTGKVSRNWA